MCDGLRFKEYNLLLNYAHKIFCMSYYSIEFTLNCDLKYLHILKLIEYFSTLCFKNVIPNLKALSEYIY